ncbi:SDR family oxidoreductase [Mesobaculum littorinae]|uniref:SDR family oxidoreductase n=1 Tax=Mesobaculum littorinae TaxID=2486419 RepID=A0A438ADQ5_9RHOB|nr:SDR family oxidoreductase [Mesobaculum littorinae]
MTGAAGLIGSALVAHFLERGWQVAALDRDAPGLKQLEREGVELRVVDVSDEAQVRAFWEGETRVDLLVNNAGIASPEAGPVETLALEDWQAWLGAGLTGPMLMVKHGARALRTAGGAVVNITSTRAAMSEPDCEPYAAAKGGLEALTHALAVSLGPDVRVNAVAPGWISANGDLRPVDHRQHPVGRVGRPEDVAGAVAWLAEAGFVTGQTVVVDGGMTRKMIYAD